MAAFTQMVGGPARRNVIVLLACVLALGSADVATVGAVGANLEDDLGIGNTDLGLLASVTAGMGALGAVPGGMLADRVHRVRLLAVAIVVWSAALVVGAASADFDMLLLTRLALGAVLAIAGPTVASLTGDFFAPIERGRIYGFILAGELLGAGFGFLISGEVDGALSWRFSFALLSLPGFVLAAALVRRLPEPGRGGQGHLAPGAVHIPSAQEVGRAPWNRRAPKPMRPPQGAGSPEPEPAGDRDGAREEDLAGEQIRERDVRPHHGQVLRRNPDRLGAVAAVRYVLSIRTNRLLILASALGYFFLSGLETFAVVFLQGHFGLSQATSTAILAVILVSAIAGALVGGRLADWLLDRGRMNARVVVPGVAYVVAAVFFLPGVISTALGFSILMFVVATFALAAPNPPLDAARLDIMPHKLWGRAEGVRTVLRNVAQAAAPFLFGVVSEALASSSHAASGATGLAAESSAQGLQYAFIIFLAPLAAGGVFMLKARRTYARDVATALASEDAQERRRAPA